MFPKPGVSCDLRTSVTGIQWDCVLLTGWCLTCSSQCGGRSVHYYKLYSQKAWLSSRERAHLSIFTGHDLTHL